MRKAPLPAGMLSVIEAIRIVFDHWKNQRRLAIDDLKAKVYERHGINVDENDLWNNFSLRSVDPWEFEILDQCVQAIASFQNDFAAGDGINFWMGEGWKWLRGALSTSKLCGYIVLEGDCLVSVPHQFWTSTRADSAASTDELDFSVWDREFRAEVLIDRAELVEVLAWRAVVSKRPRADFNSVPPTLFVRDDGQQVSQEQSGARRGAPPKFDWPSLWIEVCRYVHWKGVPDTQADLIRYLQQWASDRFGDEPAESTLKPMISRLLRELRRDFNEKAKDD